MMKKTIALVAAAGLAGLSQGQVNLTVPNQVVGDTPLSIDLNGAGIAAGTYTSYEVSVDWLEGPGIPFADEAIFAFTDAPVDTATIFYADPGAAPNAAAAGGAQSISWSGFLAPAYEGGDSLFFNALQTFPGSSANWDNINITLGFDVVGQPSVVADLGSNPNGMTTAAIGEAEVQFFSFEVAGGAGAQPWSLSLAGSTNTGGAFGDNDTEIGLYDSAGNLIATNDDEDFGNDILTSALSSDDVGALADGQYFIAVGNFNTTFGESAFDVTSTSTAVGETKLTASFIPAPASAALLALGGLASARRRR
ncbi:MAG: hypothetical protein AAFR96_01180 [Planctomycetota bacterium]